MDDDHKSVSWWLTAIFLTGLLQDPLRKCLPEQPVGVLMLFLLPALLGLAGIGRRAALAAIRTRNQAFLVPTLVLTVLIIATAVRLQKGVNGPSLQLLLLAWLGPCVALLGFFWGQVFCNELSIEQRFRVLRWLTVTLAVFCLATFLESAVTDYASFQWLGPLPPKRPWYRTVDADRFRMLCGLFRSPENAGWFAALLLPVACVAFSAPTSHGSRRWQAVLVGGIACAVCLLAGRRKMQVLMVIAVLLTASLTSFAGFRREAGRYLAVAAASLGLGCGLVALLPQAHLYLGYFSTSPMAAPARTVVSAWEPILAHSAEVSWFGAGVGEMAPGRQHLGGRSLFFTESGLVRVFVETGWLGLIVFLFSVVILLIRCIRPFVDQRRQVESLQDVLQIQISATATSILVANLFCFLIGHQIFGDPFVTFLTGAVLAVALPRRLRLEKGVRNQ